MSEEQQAPTQEDEVRTALVLYKNLQITATDLIKEFTASHKDNVTLAKVFNAVVSDMSYEADRFQNAKAQKLYQTASVILKAKEVLKNDMKQKLAEGVAGISEETKVKILKEM
jgi:hypothetical protein